MLAYISGKIVSVNPTEVILDLNGIGLKCQISLHTFSAIQASKSCKLFIHEHFKNEGQSLSALDLYGFHSEVEKLLFEMLLSVSGVGANTARMMFSSLSPEEIKRAIVTGDEKTVQGIKGIGPKSAKRIILELKDKLSKEDMASEIPIKSSNTMIDEALQALVSLGFQRAKAEKALKQTMQQTQGSELSVEELIKRTLKTL